MLKFTEMMKNCRSIYTLGENLSIPEEEATTLIKEVVREDPAASNSQTQRVVFLFGDAHGKLWAMTEDALKPLAPVETFLSTQAKLQGSTAGAGVISFFEDADIVKNLQDGLLLCADNFPVWSEQATGLTQVNVWTVSAQENIDANLQHYNPIVDEAVTAEWSTLTNWNLCAQMVVGPAKAPAGEREHTKDSARFKEFN